MASLSFCSLSLDHSLSVAHLFSPLFSASAAFPSVNAFHLALSGFCLFKRKLRITTGSDDSDHDVFMLFNTLKAEKASGKEDFVI